MKNTSRPHKSNVILWGAIAGFILTVCLGIGVAAIFKNLNFNNFNINADFVKNTIERTYNENFQKVSIKVEAGTINITESSDQDTHLTIHAEDKDTQINRNSDILDIDIKNDCRGFFCINRLAAKVELAIPEHEYDLKIDHDLGEVHIAKFTGTLNIDQDMGSIEIDELKIVSDSEIKLDLGSVNIHSLEGAIVSANADLGSVSLNDYLPSGDARLDVHVDLGDININERD